MKTAHGVIFAAVAATLVVAAGAAAALEFRPWGRGAFAEARKAHAGKPLIVHFWSVTCPPCIAELADWAKLVRDRKDLDIVFVDVDPESDRARAAARLEKTGLAEAAHYAFADASAERLYFEADRSWRGELPFTVLIGPDGAADSVTGAMDEPATVDWLGKMAKARK